jgi:hypothetical protein
VAQQGATIAAEYGREALPLPGDPAVANRVDGAVHRMKPPRIGAMSNIVLRIAELGHLPTETTPYCLSASFASAW